MDTDAGEDVNWTTVVNAFFIGVIITGVPYLVQEQIADRMIQYAELLIGLLLLISIGPIICFYWFRSSLDTDQSHHKEVISDRQFNWTVGIPETVDQIYIFLMTLGGDLFIFVTIFWLLEAFRLTRREALMMGLLSTLVFHLGKVLAEFGLHPKTHSFREVEEGFHWRKIGMVASGVAKAVLVFGSILALIVYLLMSLWGWSPIIFLFGWYGFFVMFNGGGGLIELDFNYYHEKTGGSVLLDSILLAYGIFGVFIVCIMHSAFLILCTGRF